MLIKGGLSSRDVFPVGGAWAGKRRKKPVVCFIAAICIDYIFIFIMYV